MSLKRSTVNKKSSVDTFNLSTPSIAEKTKIDTFKNVKLNREFLNYLLNPNFPYFLKKLLLLILPYFDAQLNDTKIEAKKILGVLNIKITDFEKNLKNNRNHLQSIGLEIETLDGNKKGLQRPTQKGKRSSEYTKIIEFRFSNQIKEKCASNKGYVYFRSDFVSWFQKLVAKYHTGHAVATHNFLILTLLVSTWDITTIVNIDIKKLAETVGMQNKLKKRYVAGMKTTLTKYLNYLKEDGLIEISEITKPNELRFKLLNVNAKKKEAKLQQKEKASTKQVKTPKASKEQVKTPKASTKQVKTTQASKEQVKTPNTVKLSTFPDIIGIKKFINPVPPKNVSTSKRNLVLTATKKPKIIGLENPK
jgi:hypothetical protein